LKEVMRQRNNQVTITKRGERGKGFPRTELVSVLGFNTHCVHL